MTPGISRPRAEDRNQICFFHRRSRNDVRSATLESGAPKLICTECSVQTACLEFALRVREPHGIWGGLTESERRRLLPSDD